MILFRSQHTMLAILKNIASYSWKIYHLHSAMLAMSLRRYEFAYSVQRCHGYGGNHFNICGVVLSWECMSLLSVLSNFKILVSISQSFSHQHTLFVFIIEICELADQYIYALICPNAQQHAEFHPIDSFNLNIKIICSILSVELLYILLIIVCQVVTHLFIFSHCKLKYPNIWNFDNIIQFTKYKGEH